MHALFSRWFRAAAAAAALAVVAGCGGGGGAEPDPLAVPAGPSATVPDAAVQSADAYSRFASRLIQTVGDSATAAPLLLPAAAAPGSETAAPQAVE